MGTRFRPYQPDQAYLLPPSPRDWLPEGHLAYFISDTVDALDLEAFYRRYRGSGRRACPYEPRMLLKVLIYEYCTGVFSSRKLARGVEDSVAMRYLAGGNMPSHRTICRWGFRVPCGSSNPGVEVESTTVEVDRHPESLAVAEAACRPFDRLDLGVH